MKNNRYIELFEYLKYGKLPDTVEKEKFEKYARNFEIGNNRILINNRQVILWYNMKKYLAVFHDNPTGAHFSADTIYSKMKARYVWTTMKKDIEEYYRTCDDCQCRGPPKKNNLIHPIEPSNPFDH